MGGSRERFVSEVCREPADEAPPKKDPLTRPRAVARPQPPNDGYDRLVDTINREVIPRLLLARRSEPVQPVAARAEAPSTQDVAQLADLVLASGSGDAAALVAAIRARGNSIETLYLDLLAPAARRLGELWNTDERGFAEVTLGLGRLQQLLRDLSPEFQNELRRRLPGRCILLTPVPGDQHTFGLSMVEEFFRRAGWDVWSGQLSSSRELLGMVGSQWFAVVGISTGSEARLDTVSSAIRAIRRASLNPAVGILVGGPIFVDQPALAGLVGADATAADGRQATEQAESLLALRSRAG